MLDVDDGTPGWHAYDLAVFLWSARAFAPERRALWWPLLAGYRGQRPISRHDLDAVPIRHIWLRGEHALWSSGWGTR
jgi:Ser/Thr protein kinase RdoA (MazF antagonist)